MIKGIADFKSLMIKVASPEEIRAWSHGEVTKPETINYRTLKPEKDGLFCERIFGPTKDWECYCGKYKRIRYRGIVCDKCGVEVTLSKVRRERMGHIALATPVAHVWYFRGTPSRLSLLLNIPAKSLEAIMYFAQYLVTEVEEGKRSEAISSLGDAYKEKEGQVKKTISEKREEIKKDHEKEHESLKERIKDKEALLLAEKELELSNKQKEKWADDKETTELTRLKDELTALVDKVKGLKELTTISEEDYLRLKEMGAGVFFKVGMGAETILDVLKKINLVKLASELKKEAEKSSGQRHVKAVKRLRAVEGMLRSDQDPSRLILTVLPVLPPDLRPMVQLTGGRFATSDLNDLYRRVINRNNRLKHLIELGAPDIILRNEKRMLQEAVDSLIDSNKSNRDKKTSRKAPALRSLSDMLRGKQGRFRQNLLGKRVDYSGRSVIVVGPELKLRQCGLPKEMALEMFKPFVLREMIVRGLAPNVKNAKNILERRPPEVFDILEEITKEHPVLLNRAPTLHKLGIQAFFPILIDGSAIRIHPCVCQGYNADFDGDQMAVHVPLSKKAKEEAIALMMPDHNLLKPADGTPINAPDRKEMALGIYYLTSLDPALKVKDKLYSWEEAICAYQLRKLQLREPIKIEDESGEIIETSVGRLFFNEALPLSLRFVNTNVKQSTIRELFTRALKQCDHEEVVTLIDNLKNLGFEAGTVSGVSLSIRDCKMSPEKGQIIGIANKKVAEIEETFRQGLITLEEEKRLVREVWMETTEALADKTWQIIDETNPIKLIIDAKVGRVSRDTIKQISAMRGLVVDPTGKIVDMPTKGNFREGLTVFEYVTTTRGSRKGLTDTALKTSDAGYLTRKLVDVSHEAIIREEDCGTKEGITVLKEGNRGKVFAARILGRVLAQPVVDPKTKKVLFKRGSVIEEKAVKKIEESGVSEITVRSPLTCKAKYGVCIQCYGWDFAFRKTVEMGVPVGVLAAQSIGEPGTQLTLQTKHAAGVVGLDVTQGLPRVTELLEVRMPKTVSPLAEISGKVEVIAEENDYKVRIKGKEGEKREYIIPLNNTLKVNDNDQVLAGTQLSTGALDVRNILAVRGLREAQKYLVNEIQTVYESQGIPIKDKHFEVVVRMMSQNVRIKNPGSTVFLPGELVTKQRLEEENELTKKSKGTQATAEQIIMGIKQAALYTESWLSAASFQETSNVLADAAMMGKEDFLLGLKENVIIGRLIPVSRERAMLNP
ncbi:DNA-directed RNA polymerase subunit beta' [Candidatus Shapirobacteria bacterium CG09_land_8_20_14_0_10_39_12]|uniref:DNA-directed RNA polymerase subunit beta' n=1 Tax=Candidatus Shapirobacteria bacterium CG09_land_8_20_14_0_10_39_12 TaxID=1974885 RepID=A0A2H0WPK9_9BACT|nr:MAG: DNA-directed RNA polymerase subunit beta' [Candidatus Shapirobacteria bacterium CG09_land_8_20_14_0_10_39_12]